MGKCVLEPFPPDDPIFTEGPIGYSPSAIHERLAAVAREQAAREAKPPPEWATRPYRLRPATPKRT